MSISQHTQWLLYEFIILMTRCFIGRQWFVKYGFRIFNKILRLPYVIYSECLFNINNCVNHAIRNKADYIWSAFLIHESRVI